MLSPRPATAPTAAGRPGESAPPDAYRSANATLKTQPPRLSRRLIRRPRLDQVLDDACRPATSGAPDVVAVTGPPGAGKTTWLAAWVARGPTTTTGPWRAAWVTVDESDDLRALWAAVLAACSGSGALTDGQEAALLTHVHDAGIQQLVAALRQALARQDQPLWLVLDEVDSLADEQALRSLDVLLRWMPAQLRLVLAGRHEPPLALHRLRLEGRLLDVRARDLSLTHAETVELLGGHDLRLPDEDVDLVLQRTEGWAAGVRMVALSLEGAVDQRSALATFAGDDRAVADYLVGELLDRHPPHIREFLVQISVCDRVSPDLAATLTGRLDAGALLESLVRANALIFRLGGPAPWYRCHTLLRSYLVAELTRRPTPHSTELHLRAARWSAVHGDPMGAIAHACSSGDAATTVELVRRWGLHLVHCGHASSLTRLLRQAPPGVGDHPTVALIAAAAALDSEDTATADEALTHVPSATDAATPALRAAVTLHRALLRGDFTDELRALDRAAPDTGGDRDLELLTLVDSGNARLRLGDLAAAEADLSRAVVAARESGRDHLALQCLTALAGVASSREDTTEMIDRARAALAFAAERGWERTALCASAHLIAGSGAYQQLDVEAARAHADAVAELAQGVVEPSLRFSAVLLGAVMAFDAGRAPYAQCERVRRAWPPASVGLPPMLVAHAAVEVHRMALQVNEEPWAVEAEQDVHQRLGDIGEVQYLRAALALHRGRSAQARRLLAPLCDGGTSCVAVRTVVQALVFDAVLADAAGDAPGARHSLDGALALAAPRQLVRNMAVGGPAVRRLLARNAGRFGRHEYFAGRVLAAAPSQATTVTEPLTVREQQVLAELPSLRTADEIADQQYVSVNTVKTHVRAIYRKLGVSNRREAITAARERGLL